MWTGLHELEKVHGTSNTQQERPPRQQIPTAGRSNHVSMCQLWQHIRTSSHFAEPCRHFVDQRHVQNRPQSHDLGIGGEHTSNQLQPLRARIWRFANVVRTCSPNPLAFPITDDSIESTCPVCWTTQTPQATLKIWTRAGAKDPSRGKAVEAWRSREGSCDEPSAEPNSEKEGQWYPSPTKTACLDAEPPMRRGRFTPNECGAQ